MQDANIFIFSQNVPKIYPKNKEYKLVSLEKIDEPCEIDKITLCDCNDEILKMEHAYSEGARLHALWKTMDMPKYVGTAHYRRYFEFFDNLPNFDDVFSEHDAIIQQFDVGWKSIRENYAGCHNIKDLDMCISIINEKYPEFSSAAEDVLNGVYLVPCNIFVLTRDMFNRWCEFVFGVLDEYNNRMGFKTDLDVCNHVVNHMDEYVLKGGLPNSATYYQTRIHAFLMERISTIFFKKASKNPYLCDVVLTESHFEFEKTYFKQYEK